MAKDYDELVQLRQDGKISDLLFVMDSEFNTTYLEWCQENNTEPSDESAQDFLNEIEADMFHNQTYPVEDYGL